MWPSLQGYEAAYHKYLAQVLEQTGMQQISAPVSSSCIRIGGKVNLSLFPPIYHHLEQNSQSSKKKGQRDPLRVKWESLKNHKNEEVLYL